MNEDKNELNDIVLNKNSSSIGNKKIILSVATLGIILIVIILIMNSLSPRRTDNLPQRVPPPEPVKQASTNIQEPLFEEVEVVEDSGNKENKSLDEIAQKLKNESLKEQAKSTQETTKVVEPKKEIVEAKISNVTKTSPITSKKEMPSQSIKGAYYIQIGSFEKVAPSKHVLGSVTSLGYKYIFHEIELNGKKINKVLVGPFGSEKEAREALPSIKNSVEKNAFLTKL